jgi:hypothetical protein
LINKGKGKDKDKDKDKDWSNVIYGDPLRKFDSLSQRDDGNPDDSRSAKDFLNELSGKFESNDTA